MILERLSEVEQFGLCAQLEVALGKGHTLAEIRACAEQFLARPYALAVVSVRVTHLLDSLEATPKHSPALSQEGSRTPHVAVNDAATVVTAIVQR